MKILITGINGFLGKYLNKIGKLNNHDIYGIGRSSVNKIICDLATNIPNLPQNIDIIIHAAGKAHKIPKNKQEENDFFTVNYEGTKNLVKGIEKEKIKLKQFVYISTVAVYGCKNGLNISEDHPLNGKDPYAKSKIKSEIFLKKWANDRSIPLLILRVPLLIGDYPKGNLLKLITAIKNKRYVSIGGSKARKSMLFAEDLAICIFDNLEKNGTYNLNDGYNPKIYEIENLLLKQFKIKKIINIPLFLVKWLFYIGDYISFFPFNSETLNKLSLDLTFDGSKARKTLKWKPKRVIDNFKIKINE